MAVHAAAPRASWDSELLWDVLTSVLLLGSALSTVMVVMLSMGMAPPAKYEVYDAQLSAKARFLLLDREDEPEVGACRRRLLCFIAAHSKFRGSRRIQRQADADLGGCPRTVHLSGAGRVRRWDRGIWE